MKWDNLLCVWLVMFCRLQAIADDGTDKSWKKLLSALSGSEKLIVQATLSVRGREPEKVKFEYTDANIQKALLEFFTVPGFKVPGRSVGEGGPRLFTQIYLNISGITQGKKTGEIQLFGEGIEMFFERRLYSVENVNYDNIVAFILKHRSTK